MPKSSSPPFLAALLISFCCATSSAAAQDVFIGLESFAGYRSRYEFRNIRLADHVFEAQVGTQLALTNQLSISLGAATAFGDSDFRRSDFFLDARYLLSESTALGLSQSYRDFEAAPTRDGYELGLFLEQELPHGFDFRLAWYEDRGGDGGFGECQLGHVHQFNKYTSLRTQAGISHAQDFYARKGFNDVSLRVQLRHRFNSRWALAPYVGASWAADTGGKDIYYLGLNLEFLF